MLKAEVHMITEKVICYAFGNAEYKDDSAGNILSKQIDNQKEHNPAGNFLYQFFPVGLDEPTGKICRYFLC